MVTFSPHLVDILYHNFLVLSNFNDRGRCAAAIKIIVSKNCGPTTFFRNLLECLPVNEGDETGKYIFGLCFPMVPADMGRPPRKTGGGRGKRADELGRQRQAQMLARRMLC